MCPDQLSGQADERLVTDHQNAGTDRAGCKQCVSNEGKTDCNRRLASEYLGAAD